MAYYYYEKHTDEDTSIVLRVIDDTTLSGDNLAKRRLQLKDMGVPLAKIKYAVFFLGDFIKLANPTVWFIDSAGKIFNYKKSTRAKLKFYKITKCFRLKAGGAIIEVEGLSSRFKMLFPPAREEAWAGVLEYGLSRILYGVYTEKHDESWRLI